MVRYSEELIEEIRSSNDIVDVISKYITLKRSGRNFFGLCPFHKEKSPSFAVSPDKQIFHCFGCGAGGNVIHFISKIEGLDFKDTLELLANRVNIELPTLDNLEDDKTARLKSKVYEINKIAAEFGGGGHVVASGFKCEASSMEEVVAKTLDCCRKEMLCQTE